MSLAINASKIQVQGLSALAGATGYTGDPLARIESTARIVKRQRGQRIYGAGDPPDHWYRVVSGMARNCALLVDGRRQIVELLAPGDFFGFAAPPGYDFAVEAIVTGTEIACYSRRTLEALAQSEPEVGRKLLEIALQSVSRLQARTLLLGRMTAVERVGFFLSEIADRSGADVAVLRMSRYDIADYLALSVETVSRALTNLQSGGSIAFSGRRQVRILDRAALRERSLDD